jgi:hypothetical protein
VCVVVVQRKLLIETICVSSLEGGGSCVLLTLLVKVVVLTSNAHLYPERELCLAHLLSPIRLLLVVEPCPIVVSVCGECRCNW